MDSVVHFEIPFADKSRAQKFYSNTFGWLMNPAPGDIPYLMAQTGETDDKNMPKKSGFINGGMMEKQKNINHVVITIGVEDIDAALRKAEKNGGKIVMGKQKVGDMGISAYILDTEDNVIGLWQNLRKMP